MIKQQRLLAHVSCDYEAASGLTMHTISPGFRVRYDKMPSVTLDTCHPLHVTVHKEALQSSSSNEHRFR